MADKDLRQIINLNSGGFSAPEVEALLKAFALIRADLTAISEDIAALDLRVTELEPE